MIAHYAADTPDTPALFRRDCPYRRVRSGRPLLQARSTRSVCHYGRVVGDPTPLLSCYKPGREGAPRRLSGHRRVRGTRPLRIVNTCRAVGQARVERVVGEHANGVSRRQHRMRARRSPQEATSWIASTADIRTPHAAAEPPAPPSFRCPYTAPPGRSRRPRGGHRGGAEDRSDLCAHKWCKGYGIHQWRAIGAGAWQTREASERCRQPAMGAESVGAMRGDRGGAWASGDAFC